MTTDELARLAVATYREMPPMSTTYTECAKAVAAAHGVPAGPVIAATLRIAS